MPQLIKPGTVKIMTKEGEVQVSIILELNINLNTDSVKVVSHTVEKRRRSLKKMSGRFLTLELHLNSTLEKGSNYAYWI